MNKVYLFGCAGILLVGFVFFLILAIWGFGVVQKEQIQRNLVMAKQESNKNEFDSMWKKQMQSAQITSQQKDALYNLVVGYAKARADQAKGSLAASVKEVVPNVDQNSHLFQQLMNIVNASRDVWTTKQNELIDLNRVHTNIVTVPPSSFICTLLGKDVIKITIVTSERTDESFKTGKDNEIDLFPKEKSLEK